MKARLKIAIFHFGFFYSGGGERLVLEEAISLLKKGYKVACFAPVVDYRKCFPELIKKVKPEPVLPQLPLWFPHRTTIQILACCFLIPFTFWKFRNYDVFYGANQPGPWFSFILSKILGKPYVIYLAQPTRLLHPRKVDRETGFWVAKRSYIFPFFVNTFRTFIDWADRTSIRSSASILSNGEYISTKIKKTYKVTNAVCPAGAKILPKASLNENKWEGKIKLNTTLIDKPFLLITNRHFPQKKFEYAIWAMSAVLAKFPKIKLVITGDATEYTNYLKALVKDLNLEESVIFIGYVKDEDLTKLYKSAACYLYTAPEEDFGMGIIEAMAAGTVVVAWNAGGPAKIIEDGKTGLLVKPYLVHEFAKKIIEVLSDKQLSKKVSGAAWTSAKENYSFVAHNEHLEQYLLRAVKIKKL